MDYTLYGMSRSRAFRALWMLEELGLRYRHIPAAPRAEELVAVSALGKIPVLIAGEAVIRDSTAILTYLADSQGALTHKAGSVARAHQDAWTFRILDECDALLWTAARHSFVLPEDQRVPAIKDSLKSEFASNLERISAEIAGPYVLGDEMTVPDIVLAHCGGWAKLAGFPAWPEAFADYLGRLQSRPAFQRAAAR